MEKTMEHLVAAIGRLEVVIHNDRAEMKANQTKTDANLREIRAGQVEVKEEIKSGQAEIKSTVGAV
jgi:hypothetical protein